jgi:pilus assembly protein Flp/PilA
MTDQPCSRLRALLRRFCGDERAATSIEYGLIAALMAVAIIASIKSLGNNTGGSWGNTANKASNAMIGR